MRSSKTPTAIDWGKVIFLCSLSIAVFFLWDSVVLYPLRVLVVFFHELSHAIAGFLTGGKVLGIYLSEDEGGLTAVRGGWLFVVASAGYLGSLLIGGLIVLFASRTRYHAQGVAALALILVCVTAFLVRPVDSFGFFFGIATGVILLLMAWQLHSDWSEFVLLSVGMTSCLYAFYDIKSDVFDRPDEISDAVILAALTGVPSRVWGALWIVIALATTTFLLSRACKKPARTVPSMQNQAA